MIINTGKPRLCKNCTRWYDNGVDQCNVPASGIELEQNVRSDFKKAVHGNIDSIVDEKGMEFIRERIGRYTPVCEGVGGFYVYGSPSKLNYDNTCYFYKEKKKTPKKERVFVKKWFKRG